MRAVNYICWYLIIEPSFCSASWNHHPTMENSFSQGCPVLVSEAPCPACFSGLSAPTPGFNEQVINRFLYNLRGTFIIESGVLQQGNLYMIRHT